MISEVFRPCGEHCLVVLMTELPDLDLLAVGGLPSLVSIDEPFSVFRSPGHELLPENGNAFVTCALIATVTDPFAAGVINTGICRNEKLDASISLRSVATITDPFATGVVNTGVCRNFEFHAFVSHLSVSTIANPLAAGVINTGISRNFKFYALVTYLLITTVANPVSPCVINVRVRRNSTRPS